MLLLYNSSCNASDALPDRISSAVTIRGSNGAIVLIGFVVVVVVVVVMLPPFRVVTRLF